MEKYKNFKNILDNPSIFNDIGELKIEIKECFINEKGEYIIDNEIEIEIEDDFMVFSHKKFWLIYYNTKIKELLFYEKIPIYCQNKVTKLFNKINNE